MSTLKVDYLLKDEILYELLCRGVDCDTNSSVMELRKKLRESVKENVEPSVINLSHKLSFSTELEVIDTKFSVIKNLSAETTDSQSVLDIARLETKISHVMRRLNLLSQHKLTEEQSAKIESRKTALETLFENFKSVLNSVDNDQLVRLEGDLNRSLNEEEALQESIDAVAITPSAKDEPKRIKCNTEDKPPLLPTVAVFQSTPTHVSTVPTSTSSSSANLFNKLSNPAEKYLHLFRVTDGMNITDLLDFLGNVLKLKYETNLSETDILDVIPGYTTGPLLNKVLQCRQIVNSIDFLHQAILSAFVPLSFKIKLKQDLVFRPQWPHEELAVYISEIKKFSLILRCELPEHELVSIVRSGIKPEDRNRLIFHKEPSSFEDLANLCIANQNVAYNDYCRNQFATVPTAANHRSVNSSLRPSVNESNHSRPMINRGPVICYNCGSRGHISRDCRQPRRHNPNVRYQSKNL